MNIGDIVKLKPKTRRGKNALQNKTNKWFVSEHTYNVLFTTDVGPWVRLTEMRNDTLGPSIRWVHLKRDDNFTILPFEE